MKKSVAMLTTIALIIFAGMWSNVVAGDSCSTPNNKPGECVPVADCALFHELYQRYGANLPTFFRDYLRKSVCPGTESFASPYICCATNTQAGTNPQPSSTGGASKDEVFEINSRGIEILRNTKCGNAAGNKISGGNKTKLFEFPWMALLSYDVDHSPFKCGGSLITDKFILTAAHCITSRIEVVSVRLGEHDVDTVQDCQAWGKRRICSPPAEDIQVEKIIKHAGYDSKKKINDVALIKLKRKVEFNKHIKPICLPITTVSKQLEDDQKYYIAGWGTTENGTTSSSLLSAIVPHKNLQVCQDFFRKETLTKNHICAGGEGNVDTCKGDSGGPLFAQAQYDLVPRFIQYGIVSFGINCGGSITLPGIYASVVDLLPWITTKIAENS